MNEQQIELVGKFHQMLKDEGAFIKVTPAGGVHISDEKITSRNCLTYLQNRVKNRPDLSGLLLIDANAFLNQFRKVALTAQRNQAQYDQVQVENYNYSNLIPFQSVTDANRYVIFDVKLSTVTDLDYASFKANRDTARIEPIRGRIEFNPYSPLPIDFRPDQYGRPCNFLNTYKKPAWQYDRRLTPAEAAGFKPPELFKEFMMHLFPDQECRRYVLDWLHFALTDRCETYLVLNGAKGIGKNLFSESLCKPLMGSHNHKIAQPSALESNFNALLKECRMIVFDEFRVDSPDKINKLKRYVNEEQMIERKGVDVGETTKTFNSFIISNNSTEDMKISWDDRRFSVADLTKVKLLDVWSTDKVDELLAVFADPEQMRSIGYWLMYRKPMYNKYGAFKKKHFYDLCYASFTEWQKCLIDMATSKQYVEITNAELRKEYRKRTDSARIAGFSKIKDFIENYRHEGEYSLGEVFKAAGDTWTLELSDHFAATGEIETAEVQL
jgi:hypothetical protein